MPRIVFPKLFHFFLHIGKDWNTMVCGQETPGLLDPATLKVTRINISEFLYSMPLNSCEEVLFSIIYHKNSVIQLFSCWIISRQAVYVILDLSGH